MPQPDQLAGGPRLTPMKPLDSPTPANATVSTTVTDETSASTELIEEELLVEEISIDGMCGVY